MIKIDINCDMGESYGNWSFGNDEDVVEYVTTANVAGGFHAGDPHVMRETVQLAEEYGVHIGIHPGLPDKIGFGRRKVEATPQEVQDYVVYQLGALSAFVEAYGTELQHVKPHGAMYSMLSENEEYARAVIEGVLEVDEDLSFIATDSNIYDVASEYPDLSVVFEGYIDLQYRNDRSLIIEREKEALDPDIVADRFESIVLDSEVETKEGDVIDMPAQTICIHSDTPNAPEILREIHRRATEQNIEFAPISEII